MGLSIASRVHTLIGSRPKIKTFLLLFPFSPFRGSCVVRLRRKHDTVLDVGCGPGILGKILRKRKNIRYLVGVDLVRENLLLVKTMRIYDDVVLCDVRRLPFRAYSFDSVICVQVLEHLTKYEGLMLVNELENIARIQVLISTTVGHIRSHSEDGYMLHKSGWLPTWFRRRHYVVRGEVGPRCIPLVLAYWVSFLFPLGWFFPESSYYMNCLRSVQRSSSDRCFCQV